MKVEATALNLPELLLIRPAIITDDRGYFVESFNKDKLEHLIGRVEFVQDNQSLSKRALTIRGLHFQINPFPQSKLVRVIQGSILDVAVDLRRQSSNYGKHAKTILTATNFEQLWVPTGFAHGFCTLEPNTVVFYKVTDFFDASSERGLRWNDPDLEIDWGVADSEVTLSTRDRAHPFLRDLPGFF